MVDPEHVCEKCGAMFWYNRRLNKAYATTRPTFSICCMNGKVQIEPLKRPPKLFNDLLYNRHENSMNYKDNIRAYNSMYAFTSVTGVVDQDINNGRGPYLFKMEGKNDHIIGSLLPNDGHPPRFSQLYIFDTDNEVQNRINAVRKDKDKSSPFDESIVVDLKDMLDVHNTYTKTYKMAKARIGMKKVIKLRLIGRRGGDGKLFIMSTASEVTVIIEGDIDNSGDVRDIVIEQQDGALKHIHDFDKFYLPLQYPLLFVYGEDGDFTDIPRNKPLGAKRSSLSVKELLSFRFQEMIKEGSQLMRSGQFLHQFMVDAYVIMDTQRLQWIRHNQPTLRVETYKNLLNASVRGDIGEASVRRVILTSTYTDRHRWMA